MQLRRRVVSEPPEPSEEELQSMHEEVRRYRLRRLCIAAAALGAALLVFLLWNFISSRIHYETAEIVREKEAAGESVSEFMAFQHGNFAVRKRRHVLPGPVGKPALELWLFHAESIGRCERRIRRDCRLEIPDRFYI